MRPWAKQICFSEWDLALSDTKQLSHLLSVLVQGKVEAFRKTSDANIQTPIEKEKLLSLIKEAGWQIKNVNTVDSSTLDDGYWESQTCQDSIKLIARREGLPERLIDLLDTELALIKVFQTRFGRSSLNSYTVLAA